MDNLVDPAEPLDVQVARLKKISQVLMRRIETRPTATAPPIPNSSAPWCWKTRSAAGPKNWSAPLLC